MEYFVTGHSNPAPFFGDPIGGYVEADSPRDAVRMFELTCKHPCGVNNLRCYASADDYHKGNRPLAER